MKPKREWTSEDDSNLKRLNAAGLSDGEIGLRMKRDRWLIGRRRRGMGLQPGQSAIQTMMMCRLRTRMKCREYRLTFESLSLA